MGWSCEPLPVPIANCYVTGDSTAADPDRVVQAWAESAGVSPNEMTVNLISVSQGGKRYAAMAWLYLPSLWSDEDVVALGEGLAAALAATLSVEPHAVQVLTTVVTSSSVIEAGQALRW